MMRICSLLPSATEILYVIGAGEDVVGVTHECDFPPEARQKPVVVRSLISHDEHSSADVDRLVREALRDGRSLYTVDAELLATLSPDLIVTQELCEVCAIDSRQVARAIAELPSRPRVVSLHPHTLEDMLQDVLILGEATGRAPAAIAAVTSLRQRIAAVRKTAAAAAHRPRVVCLEWLEPLMGSGHWVPEMVTLAGGIEPIGRAGSPSVYITWDEVVAARPDVLLLMPCGMPIARATQERELLTQRAGWTELPAVRDGRVYLVDGSAYYNRSGPRLVDGLEITASLIHPELFADPLPAGAATALATTR